MRKALLILFITLSPAFADDQIGQRNVYDVFRQWEPKTDAAVLDEQTTARIKRQMANLLYPVDLTHLLGQKRT